ncbi:MAG: PLDc N-terminal domain-containing protein, partial [Paludibacteraceae bacterium]|nr:PLDc N-terminal domain-containing protein [Paludibacteraceae bacterium]
MLTDILYYIFVALYIYSVYLAFRLVFGENREAIRTLGWMIVLLFVPVLGLVIYTVFGQAMRQNKRILKLSIRSEKNLNVSAEERERVENMISEDMQNTGVTNTKNVMNLIRLLYGSGKSLVYQSSDIRILSEPKNTFDSLFRDLEAAKD